MESTCLAPFELARFKLALLELKTKNKPFFEVNRTKLLSFKFGPENSVKLF